ncbi:MAG: sodium/solute symporter [Acidobacteria bacterium]|nr:sodium/solute symporter [Acidobacteriota bacterium]
MPDRILDLGLIVAYLITVTVFGARFGGRQKTLRDYFLGGREAPWWAISLSIVSAETSTLTIIGTPALAFGSDLGFLQLVFGYLLARLVISALFIPAYWKGEMFTAYKLIERRFGDRLRRLTATTFLVTRSLAEGVRVFAISLVVGVVLETGDLPSILLITVLTLFYTFHGGMTAVIWTDVAQMALYVSGALLSFWLILHELPAGWETVAASADKWRILHWGAEGEPYFQQTYTFWAGLLGGCFLATATHGTDQLVVQRLLSAKTQQASRVALLSSWVVVFFQFTLFLTIGVLLYVWYDASGLPAPQPLDRLYPEFIWRELPPVAAGIVIASILAAAMSNISAALNSLASATMMDLLLPAFGARIPQEEDRLKLSRWVTLGWGVVLMAIAVAARQWGSVLEAGLSIASIPLGALLGVFCLGVLTRRVSEAAAMTGMALGLSAVVYLSRATEVAWTWYVVTGAVTTFVGGLLASYIFPPAPAREA